MVIVVPTSTPGLLQGLHELKPLKYWDWYRSHDQLMYKSKIEVHWEWSTPTSSLNKWVYRGPERSDLPQGIQIGSESRLKLRISFLILFELNHDTAAVASFRDSPSVLKSLFWRDKICQGSAIEWSSVSFFHFFFAKMFLHVSGHYFITMGCGRVWQRDTFDYLF